MIEDEGYEEIFKINYISPNLTSVNILSEKFRKLSLYLSEIKNLSDDYLEILTLIFKTIPNIPILSDENLFQDYQIVSNLICSFIDFIKLRIPDLLLEHTDLKFYFTIFFKWLENYAINTFNIPNNLKLKFDYILHRLAKTNILILLLELNLEEYISKIMGLLIRIQDQEKFPINTPNFNYIAQIFKGIFDEAKSINVHYLNELLINFDKKNRDIYNLVNVILFESKNIIANPINQLIYQIIHSDKKNYPIMKIQGERFSLILKSLCKINLEFILNFFCTIPNKNINKTKINGCYYHNILDCIFSNKNSLSVIKSYNQIFMSYLELINDKSLKENDKFKIFTTLMKILYKNNKKDLKKENIYETILSSIKNFLTDVKYESTILNIFNSISSKFLKNKKISPKLLELTKIFLDNKSQIIITECIKMYFILIKKKIINTTLYDLFSIEKKNFLKKHSFLFNELVIKYDYYLKIINKKLIQEFDDNMFALFDNESNCHIIIILFYLTISNNQANNNLHKYLIDCLDNFNLNLEKAKNILDDDLEDSDNNVIFSLFTNIKLTKKERSDVINLINNKDNIISLKKSFLIYFDQSDLFNILDVGCELMGSICNEVEFIQTILCVIFYHLYLRCNSSEKIVLEIGNKILCFIEKIFDVLENPNKSIIDYIKIILCNLYKTGYLDENIKATIQKLSIYSFKYYKVSIKSLAYLFIEINNINNIPEHLLPIDFEENFYNNENKISYLKFINQLISLDSYKYKILFNNNYKEYITNNLENYIQDAYQDLQIEFENIDETEYNFVIKDYKHKFSDLIFFRYEILTYQLYYSLYNNLHEDFLKYLFNRLHTLNNIDNIDNRNVLTDKLKIFINNININKCLNLIFIYISSDMSISQENVIQLSDIALLNEITVRDHFLNRLETISKKTNISYMTILPLCTLYFNDPDRLIKKRSNVLFTEFCRFLIKKYEDNMKDVNISKLYKLLPEYYITNIIMYFIFNENLNKHFRSNNIKYFETIITSYLKIIKNVTNDKYDSQFIIQNLLKIKKNNLTNQKIIKNISNHTYLISSNNNKHVQITTENYENVKNEICDLCIRIINREFTTNFQHGLKTSDNSTIYNRLSEIPYNTDKYNQTENKSIKYHDYDEISYNDNYDSKKSILKEIKDYSNDKRRNTSEKKVSLKKKK